MVTFIGRLQQQLDYRFAQSSLRFTKEKKNLIISVEEEKKLVKRREKFDFFDFFRKSYITHFEVKWHSR